MIRLTVNCLVCLSAYAQYQQPYSISPGSLSPAAVQQQQIITAAGITAPGPQVKNENEAWLNTFLSQPDPVAAFWSQFRKDSSNKPQLFLDPSTGEKVYVNQITGKKIRKTEVESQVNILEKSALKPLQTAEEEAKKKAEADASNSLHVASKYFTKSPRLANITTEKPLTIPEKYIDSPFLIDLAKGIPLWAVDPATNAWVLISKTDFQRIKPIDVNEIVPEGLSYYPRPILYTNADNGKPAFFFNETIQQHYYLDQISGIKFNAENDFQPENFQLLKQRQDDKRLRKAAYLDGVLRDECDNVRFFFEPIQKIQVVIDGEKWLPIPPADLDIEPLFKPIYIERLEWLQIDPSNPGNPQPLIKKVIDASDPSNPVAVCSYVDISDENKLYDTRKHIIPTLPKPLDMDTSGVMQYEFVEFQGALSVSIYMDLLMNQETGLPISFTNVNPSEPNKSYYRHSITNEFISRDAMASIMAKSGGKSNASGGLDIAGPSEHELTMRPSDVPKMVSVIEGSAEDLSNKIPMLTPLPNKNTAFLQLRERTGMSFLKSLMTMIGGLSEYTVMTYNWRWTTANNDNQGILKPFIEKRRDDIENQKQSKDLRVQYYAIVKDHLWFNFTKFNIQEPSWFTILRHPLDEAYSQYGVCINGTNRNPDFKGPVCNKKFRMRGADTFANSWSQCMADTIEASGGDTSTNLELSDCVSEKSYALLKYTCGQHPICRNRLDTDTDARTRMLEFTKRRILFDYAAVGVFEEFELSLSLFAKMMPRVFGMALDVIYGQRNIGLRRIELVRALRKMKQSSMTNHPSPSNWSENDLKIMTKYFSYEMDLYEFARSVFWKRIKAYGVKRFVPAEDIDRLIEETESEEAHEAAKRLDQERKDRERQEKADWTKRMEDMAQRVKARNNKEEAAERNAMLGSDNYKMQNSIDAGTNQMMQLAQMMNLEGAKLEQEAAMQQAMLDVQKDVLNLQTERAEVGSDDPNQTDEQKKLKAEEDEAMRLYQEELAKEQQKQQQAQQRNYLDMMDPMANLGMGNGLGGNLQNQLAGLGFGNLLGAAGLGQPAAQMPAAQMMQNPMAGQPMMMQAPMGQAQPQMMMGQRAYREYL